MIPAWFYQQFDADFSRAVPAEGFGGWQREEIPLALEHTGVVVMHAWDCGQEGEYPGWWRAAEEIPRSYQVCRTVLPPLLAAVREAGLALFHVVGGGDYYQQLPGYRRAAELAGPAPAALATVARDPVWEELNRFRADRVFQGARNRADLAAGWQRLDFAPAARPVGGEGVAQDGRQLFALCREAGVNHLIYAGFCLNWCLLMSPGGMLEMSRRGVLCSAFRQATVAVERKETAREELNKGEGLWRVAVEFGFVFDVEDLVGVLNRGQL
jgi:hypothetical protein